ncbi:MAG: hypothetical protein KDD42_00315 [Bdellovibrionales bacterium]|nr:hypothetical protein [Bdellovibrionales bacterium]
MNHSHLENREVSVESLNVAERKLVDDLRKLSGKSSTLVGVFRGFFEWDLRPLILERGVTYLLRFSAPLEKRDASIFAAASWLANSAARAQVKIEAMQAGEIENRVWSYRPYYQHLLINLIQEAKLHSQSLRQIISQVIREIHLLHAAQRFHGHVCLSNLALEPDWTQVLRVRLVDHCFAYLELAKDPSRSAGFQREIAPELLAGAGPNGAADIYSLGCLLSTLAERGHGLRFNAAEVECISAMQADRPEARPSLKEIEKEFQVIPPAQLSNLDGIERAVLPIGSGKIIQSRIAQGRTLEIPSKEAEKSDRQISTEDEGAHTQASQTISLERASEEELVEANSGESRSSRDLTPSRNNSGANWIIVVLLVVLGVLLANRYELLNLSFENESDLRAKWFSNQPSQMLPIAEAALDDATSVARSIIFLDALAGSDRPKIQSDFLRAALNPAWEAELTDEDKRVILALAVVELLPDKIAELPGLSEVHPGVALALASGVSMEHGLRGLEAVKPEQLSSLSGIYGKIFKLLAQRKIPSMNDPQALALSHVLFDRIDSRVLDALLDNNLSSKEIRLNLRLLLLIAQENASLLDQLFRYVQQPGSAFSPLLKWFREAPEVGWERLPQRDLLAIYAGLFPDKALEIPQLADMLSFPQKPMQIAARQLLLERLGPELRSTLFYFADNKQVFSRTDIVALVLALRSKAGDKDALLDAWLRTNPHPSIVLGLLLARRDVEREDSVNLALARFLSNRDFKASLPQLTLLASHPEVMARALAISRLNPRVREELKLLETVAVVEPNQRLRTEIGKRIKSFKESK